MLFAMSKITGRDNNYFNRSVLLSFSDYCSFIQQSYNNRQIHGTVRNAFYDIKTNCDLIIKSESHYIEPAQSVIIVFKKEFIETLTTSDRIALPMNLFVLNKGEYMPNYSLALAIYSKAAKTNSRKIKISILDIIVLLGGQYSDYYNPPKNWKTIYVKRISNALLKLKASRLITSYSFLLGEDKGLDPYDCNKDPENQYNKPDAIDTTILFSNYEKMTSYYRIYIDVEVVITIKKPESS